MKENIININSEKISEICQRYKISELAIFGSMLRGDYDNESDIDLLVEFIPNAGITLFNLVDIKEEFEKLFGREVDIVSKKAIKNSKNYIRKKAILDNYKVIYVS